MERHIVGGVLGCTSPGPDGQYVVFEGDDGLLYLAILSGKPVAVGDRILVDKGDVKMYIPRDRLGPGRRAKALKIIRALEEG